MRYWDGMEEMLAFGFFALLLLLAILGLLVVLVVRSLTHGGSGRRPDAVRPAAGYAPQGPAQPPDALRILDDRLARGDIDVNDYEARKRALRSDNPQPQGPPPMPPME